MLKRTYALLLIPTYPIFLLCMLFQGMAISISAPFLAVYFTEKLGVTAGTFGIFTAVTLLSGVALSMFIAKRSDAGLNRRRLMVICMMFNAVAFSGYIFIHDFYPLLAYMTIFTAAGAPAMPQLFASAREAVSASSSPDHALANSALRSMFSLGFISGPLAGAALLSRFGFQGIFSTTTLIFLINALLVFSFVRPSAAKQQPERRVQQPAGLQRNARVLVPFLILTLLYTGHWANNLNISLFIVNTLGGTTQNVASVASVCALMEIPFMLVLGLLSAKYDSKVLLGWGMAMGGIYYALVMGVGELWQLIAGQVLLAFFVAVISAIGISYIQDLLPDLPGYASTLYTNATTIGRLAGSLAGGAAAQWLGYRHSYLLCVVLVVCSLGLLLWPRRSPDEKITAPLAS
ncbi:sugar efflux transporter [Paenibacillus sp. FSL P4-0338]|uniref:sugar efflux transporter n=1 Tax=unclassified Paenibacillus TaxID=185978 RepID=UPI0003E228E6|nr:sugar efflux transporter [Paenibacillus sp. FSL R7-269]ETT55594.1 Permease of the major facilitator superfamily protein [Paenibacillus sp. FSL R7-269]